MAKEDQPKAWKNADSWQSAGIAGAIITPIAAGFFLPWILAATDDQSMLHRVQIIGAGVAVGLAFITFCTVVWRGLISAEQAQLQRLQIDKLSEQIAASAESNLVDLLQRGAELIEEPDKSTSVGAGIAILRSVVVQRSGLFAVEAMNLLADYVQDEFARSQIFHTHLRSAIAALADGSEMGRVSGRVLVLRYPDNSNSSWPIIITGVKGVRYMNGEFWGKIASEAAEAEKNVFSDVTFGRTTACVDSRFSNCTFFRSHITGVEDVWFFTNSFQECNFSGSNIDDPGELLREMTLEAKNWFDPANPPRCSKPVEWTRWLLTSEPTDEIPF